MPYTEVTHESDSVKKLSQLLRLVQVSTNLDTLKSLKPNLTTALELFLAQFKGLDIHKVTKITSPHYGEQHNCTYIELVVRAILDSGAPGNIVSTRLVKKLKLAPDLDYNEEFGTAGPDKTKALGAYSSLPLCFGKLVVTAPAIVLHNESYDILIRTSFMATYRTIINHQDSTFSILGHSVPMFYHGDRPRDLPTKKPPPPPPTPPPPPNPPPPPPTTKPSPLSPTQNNSFLNRRSIILIWNTLMEIFQ
ncbi:hypothetical protein DSO57_1010505 [Entomophthora muscae]|uniref:Uncharacterized protein n=1 Tax=Entomophthora muscae TaxID=34485 RepID=A0ACC2T7G7_9FUNG|nr:hypothetical protein DSO57_1010505 [Entomophthora muscae]